MAGNRTANSRCLVKLSKRRNLKALEPGRLGSITKIRCRIAVSPVSVPDEHDNRNSPRVASQCLGALKDGGVHLCVGRDRQTQRLECETRRRG